MEEKVKIIVKNSSYGKEHHLVLPKEFELSWAYFHKYFRVIDRDNEEEQKLIDNFYKAFAELPEKYLEGAEENLLQLTPKD